MAKKGKSKSGGASAGKRTARKGGAPLKDLDPKKGRQVRGGGGVSEQVSLPYSKIHIEY